MTARPPTGVGRRGGATLLALLADDAAAAEDAPGEGWPPIHAVDLLVDVRAEETIVPMLVALRGGDFDDILASRIAGRLPRLGMSDQHEAEPIVRVHRVVGEQAQIFEHVAAEVMRFVDDHQESDSQGW